MNKEEFIVALQELKISITETQLTQLNQYYNLLIAWNKVMNLTGIIEEKEVYLKHFYDSLTISKVIDLNTISSLCDVGTGAGFPGIVLKIFYPQLKVTLVDSLQKRITFLNTVISQLKLVNIETIHTRIEDFALTHRNQYDVVTVRAVASLNMLLEYCIPITKINGYFIPLKGNISEEIRNSAHALQEMKSEIIECCEFYLPIENSVRNILKIRKKQENLKYPRKYSEMKKNPL